MEPGQSLARSTRLAQIQHLLHKNPRGLTTGELSKLCAVCVRTIQRDILTLQTDPGVPLIQNGDRYGILESYVLPPVSLSLYEAMALFLASRLALRQTDKNNPHIQTALGKISSVLVSELGQRLRTSIEIIAGRPTGSEYVRIFEQVAIAWSTQRCLRIQYQSLKRDDAREWLLEPYFVEMTGVGFSVYVIGHARSGEREGTVTFKLDRIREAELLEDCFEIPEGLSLDKMLGSSRGVVWGEETEVKLRFSPEVTRRVKESVWHPSQVIEDLPDGACTLTVRVGSTMEMTPWIRGWGPDAEVLEPEHLRVEFAQYARKLDELYRRH